MEDIGPFQWGCHGTSISGVNESSGYQNTLDIVSGCLESHIAASKALSYESGGYPDWYLPSIGELNMMYGSIGQAAPVGNIGGFEYASYWSSTQISNIEAYLLHFHSSMNFPFGPIDYGSKSNSEFVRPIRSF